MSIQKEISVLSVTDLGFVKTTQGGYNAVEVAYKSDGKVEGKKLMDFAGKAIYAKASAMKPGQNFTITLEKKGDFWNWIEVESSSAVGQDTTKHTEAGSPASLPAATGRVTGSNYETPQERKLRRDFEVIKHRQIGRQGCLNIALGYLEQAKIKPDGKPFLDLLKTTARDLEVYVFGEVIPTPEEAQEAISNMSDDIPY